MDRSNRVTLPKEVRETLRLAEGDYVGFRIEGKQVVLAKVRWEIES